MAYALVSTTAAATVVTPIIKTALSAKAAQGDAIMFTDEAGILPLEVRVVTNAASGSNNVAESWGYGTIRANGLHAATAKTIAYDTAVSNERLSGGYFVMNPTTGEIMYVQQDSGYSTTSGTLTVTRGALGTTAAQIADDQYMFVMNVLTLNASTTGKVLVEYMSLGHDPSGEWF